MWINRGNHLAICDLRLWIENNSGCVRFVFKKTSVASSVVQRDIHSFRCRMEDTEIVLLVMYRRDVLSQFLQSLWFRVNIKKSDKTCISRSASYKPDLYDCCCGMCKPNKVAWTSRRLTNTACTIAAVAIQATKLVASWLVMSTERCASIGSCDWRLPLKS